MHHALTLAGKGELLIREVGVETCSLNFLQRDRLLGKGEGPDLSAGFVGGQVCLGGGMTEKCKSAAQRRKKGTTRFPILRRAFHRICVCCGIRRGDFVKRNTAKRHRGEEDH